MEYTETRTLGPREHTKIGYYIGTQEYSDTRILGTQEYSGPRILEY